MTMPDPEPAEALCAEGFGETPRDMIVTTEGRTAETTAGTVSDFTCPSDIGEAIAATAGSHPVTKSAVATINWRTASSTQSYTTRGRYSLIFGKTSQAARNEKGGKDPCLPRPDETARTCVKA
ncbi:hypothetical protein YTPLAS18_03410 [Nitrospira sp.]|nr:hypothetical protein YTPLAS18_03410 [Nitrospira sp.]